MSSTPQICFRPANNYDVDAVWLDLDSTITDKLTEYMDKVHQEEWEAIDYSDCPNLGRWPSLTDLGECARLYEEYSDGFFAVIDYCGDTYNLAYVENVLREGVCEGADDTAEWAQDTTEDIWDIPDYLRFYIDWEAVGRDLLINDYCKSEWNGISYYWRTI